MLIGEDFTKIRIDLNGLVILEPNAVISDFIMALASFYIAKKLYSTRRSSGFLKYWYYFFLTFAFGSILGSMGHGLFHYLGPQGKFPTWISAILSTYFIEKAMIKSYEQYNKNNILGKIAFFKNSPSEFSFKFRIVRSLLPFELKTINSQICFPSSLTISILSSGKISKT